jgi:aspartate aminotransferase-like enzyme
MVMPMSTGTREHLEAGESLDIRVAREPWEFEAIHRLNYETFVEEIPQHPPNAERRLVDRFHHENTYVIATRGPRLVGMIVLRSKRPFSLDGKLPDLDRHLPPGCNPCEIRLLATTQDSRQGFVFRGLVAGLARHALTLGHDIAVISGTTRQLRLYRHVGFEPFGPLVGTAEAPYQPMRLTLATFTEHGRAFLSELKPMVEERATGVPLRFLPGPVTLRPAVRDAIAREPISHRSAEVAAAVERIALRLTAMTGAHAVHLIPGSGTLANDAVAQVIAGWRVPGIVLTNGVFGDRLVDQARRAGLQFDCVRAPWGQPFDAATMEAVSHATGPVGWIWATHGETSTGVLNDLATLRSIAGACGARLVIDAVSSLGAARVDLRGVTLASATSGKALGALPGVAMVFRDDGPMPAMENAPRAIDLDLHARLGGIPHTISSTLLFALDAALASMPDAAWRTRYEQTARLGRRVRDGCVEAGFRVIADRGHFDAVTTVEPPARIASVKLGETMDNRGIELHYRTRELRERNWLQIALMGEQTDAEVERLLGELATAVRRLPSRISPEKR